MSHGGNFGPNIGSSQFSGPGHANYASHNAMALQSHWNEHPQWNQFRSNNWGWNEHWRGGAFAGAFWRYGGFFPWWDPWWDLGFGWWYPYYYSNFWNYYPACWTGAVDYATYPYYSYVSPTVLQTNAAPEEQPAPTGGYYTQAVEAFHAGDYHNSLKLAGHAAIDDPQNPAVHLMLSLSLFAAGNYDGAAMEAHAIAAMGKTPDWATLYGFYGNVEKFTDQLRALEKDVGQHASVPTSRFLLGFLYLSEGHKEAARTQLLKALKLAPHDRVAANLLVAAGGQVPADIAEQLSHPPGQGPLPGGAPAKPPVPAPPPTP
jgi:tetratricopeptide (TPR) repeat protein